MNKQLNPIIADILDVFVKNNCQAKNYNQNKLQPKHNITIMRQSQIDNLVLMNEALSRNIDYKNSNDYEKLQSIGRLLEYLQGWVEGKLDDDDILTMIKIILI